jgi:hypothetical protein
MMPLYSFDLLPGPAGNTNHEMLANDSEARAAAYRMARELARNRKCSPTERVVVTDLYGAVVEQVYLHTASIIDEQATEKRKRIAENRKRRAARPRKDP